MLKKTRSEKGAIVVEATLSLSVYIILIFMILSIIDMANTQSKIKVTLNNVAKEMSQFAYAYHAAGLDNAEQNLMKGHENVTKDINEIKSGFDSLKNVISGDSSGSEDIPNIEDAVQIDSSLGDGVVWLFGKAENWGKEQVIALYAKHYMQKNLKDFRDDTAEAFLDRHHIKDGLDNLKFDGSKFVTYGSGTDIVLNIEYEVEMFKFFDLDFEVKINDTAQTKAWLGGIPAKDDR